MNIRKEIFLFILLFVPLINFGQDIHFSQFNNSPLNLNPAQTGFFRGSHRFVLNHRNQWASVTAPYSTFSGSFDMQLLKRKFKQDIIGIGIVFNNDIAGDADMGTTAGSISLSYTKGLNKRNSHFISIGIQAGGAQHKFDYTKLNFDNQFDGDQYNPNIGSGENFKNNSYSYLDFSGGIHWFLQKQDQLIFNAGFAAFHLNQPKLSFFDNKDVFLHTRFVAYGNVIIGLNKTTEMIPSVLVMQQGIYNQIVAGADFKFILNSSPYFYSTFSIGTYLRNQDAIILKAGMDVRRWNFGISYDFNFSDLHPASKYMGGYELSVTYILNQVRHKKLKEIPCPIF